MLFFIKKWQKCLFFYGFCILTACQSLDISQKNIFHPKTNRYLTLAEFVQETQFIPMILLGEQHNNTLHHQAETALFHTLWQAGNLKSVVLEMLPSSQQNQINSGLKTIRKHNQIDSDVVQQNFPWTEGWDWSLYRQFITDLSRTNVQILGGNLDRKEIDTLFHGAYPLNGNLSTQPQVQTKIAESIVHHHKMKPADPHIQTMVSIQQFKDRRMAETMIKNDKTTLLIAGNFHVNKSVGIPLHLIDFGRKDFIVISLAENITDLSPQETDYIWLLPSF